MLENTAVKVADKAVKPVKPAAPIKGKKLKKDNDKYKGKDSKYKKVIIEPIIKSDDCDYIVSGIIKYYEVKSGDWTATIDFGDGTCDDVAIKTTDEGDYTFTISEYFK